MKRKKNPHPTLSRKRARVKRRRARRRKNPIAIITPNPAAGGRVLYNRALEIRATGHSHPEERKHYFKHTFGPGVKIIGLKDGSVLLKAKKKRLWGKA